MSDPNYLQQVSTQVRRDIIRMVNGAASGHPGGSLGATDYLVALFFEIMDHDPKNFDMDGKGQDIFVLSNGHLSAALYSVLSRSGYFPPEELGTFRKLGTRLQGHPCTEKGLPGIRIATGSLGQGLSVAIGVALAKKLDKDPKRVFCLMGDGELQEGQIWEAAMYAAANKVDNLIAAVDYNGKQIDGSLDDVMPLGDLKAKWDVFGWKVLEAKGNDMEDLIKTLHDAISYTDKGIPVVILLHTEMGFGVDFMMGTHKWHGVAPNDEETARALDQLEETLGDY
ncbi:MAG: transketolase [Bacteroidetes bacterium]|nr:MAG: transketolase [Bacteroidota bacterium]RLD77281.1 MAG: transketolase [Bacteroidota bacterium]